MRGKCHKCGLLIRFPYYVKNNYKICRRCGGSLKQFYVNEGERQMDLKNNGRKNNG